LVSGSAQLPFVVGARFGEYAGCVDPQRIIVETGGADWLTPVATVVAVFVGGFVTWLVQQRLARRGEQAEAKASARVIAGDISVVASRIKDMAVDDHRWFGFDDLRLPHWKDHGWIVARELSAEDWETVSQSALELEWVTAGMEKSFAPGGPHEGERVALISPDGVRSFRRAWENATKAYNALASLADIPRERRLLHEAVPPVGGGV
jgi:hypothetical protein